MKIIKVQGREIFDSRGMPTIACAIFLSDGTCVEASVPSGASCGQQEATVLHDGGTRFDGWGVSKAAQIIDTQIAPVLLGKAPDMLMADALLVALDGTENKSNLGANTLLAVSIAVCKAQAVMNEKEPFELIAELHSAQTVMLPFPLVNVINGGIHAGNGLPFQEIMLVPVGAQNFRLALEQALTVFHTIKKILLKSGKSGAVGDEGGFAPLFTTMYEPFDLIMQALEVLKLEESFVLAIDVAADQLYDQPTDRYRWYNGLVTAEDLIGIYADLSHKYPLYSVEDGLAEHDWSKWKLMYQTLGDKLQIVGDDIFVSKTAILQKGIDQGIANSAIIKPNQVGTISEALEALELCKANGISPIVSHRSGETNDDFIADFAVGTSAGQIKCGGGSRGERMAKYNRLLEIEDMLTFGLLSDV